MSDFLPLAGQIPSAATSARVIKAQLLFDGLFGTTLLGLKRGEHDALVLVEIGFLELPGQAHPLAVADLIFDEQGVVLGREDADTTVVVRIGIPIIYRQDGDGRGLWIGRQERRDMEDSPERDVS